MAKRKSKKISKSAVSANQEKKGAKAKRAKSIWRYEALSFLMVCVLPTLITVALYHLSIGPLEAYNQKQQRQYLVQNLSDQIHQIIKTMKLRVENIAGSEAIVQSLKLDTGIQAMETNIAEFDHRVAAARIVKRGQLRVDKEADPPVTYQSIDMIRRAIQGDEIEPELEGQYIRYAFPVKDQENDIVLGAIMLEYHKDIIQPSLQSETAKDAYLQVEQSFAKGKSQEIWLFGNRAISGAPSIHQASSKINDVWSLTYIQKQEEVESKIIYTLAAAGVIISLGCLFFLSLGVMFLGKALKEDLSTLANAAQSLALQKKTPKEGFKLILVLKAYELIHDALVNRVGLDNKKNTSAENPSQPKKAPGKAATGGGQDNNMGVFANPLFETGSIINDGEEEHSLEANTEELPTAKESAKEIAAVEKKTTKPEPEKKPKIRVPKDIFRAYDIRGVVGKGLSVEVVLALGKAIGTQALIEKQSCIVVARDGRLSGPSLMGALKEGLLSTGIDVIDIGMAPTPVLYFAAHHFKTHSGVMLTGSHNPPSYNGLKIVINGTTLSGDQIQGLRKRIEAAEFKSGRGKERSENGLDPYSDHILSDIVLARSLKVVVDCGNGVTGTLVPNFFEQLGCEVDSLYAEVDGQFPNHHPDPSNPKNLEALQKRVIEREADLGVAFDGDGDRIGLVTSSGKIIYPDRLMMLFAKDLLARNPGADIIFDVKCTSDLSQLISSLGGRPIMCKTGHSLIKAKLKETQAILAGEMSGHIFFNDRWFGFDDALYSAARLLEVLSMETKSLDEIFSEFPEKVNTPELHIPVDDVKKFEILELLAEKGDFGGGRKTLLDGIRVEYDNGWGLVRASNTTPVLVTRFEADTEDAVKIIQTKFRDNLLLVSPDLELPF